MINKNLKGILVFVLMFSFLAGDAFAATYITDAPIVSITKVRQDPNPAVPGEIIDLLLEVENLGSGEIESLEITIPSQYPISVYGDINTKQIGSLQGYQEGSNSVQVNFKLFVNLNAEDESVKLEIRYAHDAEGSGTSYISNEIEILVDNPSTGFEVTGSQVSENIAEVYVVNSGRNTASSILMFVNDERAYSIDDLEAGALATAYVALPDNFNTSDLLNINFQYTDSANIRRESTSFARIYPLQVSDIEVLVRDISGSIVTVAIVNAGNFPLYAVSVKSIGYSSATQSIVGNLDAGDYSLATFTLSATDTTALPSTRQKPNDSNTSNLPIGTPTREGATFEVSYTDTLGERRTSIELVPLAVSTADASMTALSGKTKAPASANTTYLLMGFGGLVVFGTGFWWFKKKRGKSKKR